MKKISGTIFKDGAYFTQREELKEDIKTDVCIIGGGICGILTAKKLNDKGVQTVILEADRLCSGQTGGTTAKISAHHGYFAKNLTERYGVSLAREYAAANMRAVKEFERIVKEENIDCDFAFADSYLYSLKDRGALEKECKALSTLGFDAEMTECPELPFKTAGAIRVLSQACFNPLKFLSALSENLTVYEKTRVSGVKGNTVFTKGGVVTAKNIVFACHFPILNFPGMYFAKMYRERSYVLALETDFKYDGMYIGLEKGTFSLRRYKDFLLFGGGEHRAGKTNGSLGYEYLEKAAEKFFPDCRIAARNSAEDCMAPGILPYVGRYSEKTPNMYVATGFSKWGMTNSMAASEIISSLITGNKAAGTAVYSPSLPKKNGAAKIIANAAHSVSGLACEYLTIPFSSIKDIPIGEGKTVMCCGKKVGVYRESESVFHAVSTKCPHLGCQLSWNSNEKTWDCPCHGSRFDFTGRLITNPSVKDLSMSCTIKGERETVKDAKAPEIPKGSAAAANTKTVQNE